MYYDGFIITYTGAVIWDREHNNEHETNTTGELKKTNNMIMWV